MSLFGQFKIYSLKVG